MNGRYTYSWWTTDSLLIGQVEDVVLDSLRADHIVNDHLIDPNERFYHYTNVDALLGLLSSKSIWLSDYGFLNDSTEVAYGYNVASTILADLELPYWSSSTDIKRPDQPNFAEMARREQSSLSVRPMIASFTTEPDDLSQWRAYGNVCVGVRAHSVVNTLLNDAMFCPVIYDEQSQRTVFEKFFKFRNFAFNHDADHYSYRDIEKRYLDDQALLLRLASMMKHSSFSPESEIRAAYFHPTGSYLDNGEPIVRYRSRNDLVIPYVSSSDLKNFSHQKEVIVESIKIGPHPQSRLLKSGIERMIADTGADYIAVDVSEIPYRP
ncbi:DUF2971 domain-containing protein [Parvularcula oceani]|uniref:DUF2971 domain-containing protein n=1 Tax=Parvularcula oceani TaxID=1247963 RepID=UPI0012DC607D|nr:DUF2971 domain-containing protein [Parvularcula oceani]